MQSKKQILLKVTNDGIFYNPIDKIDWDHTNFPEKKHFKFSDADAIYWLVEMVKYSESNSTLSLKIQDYDCEHIVGFDTQNSKKIIKALNFQEINWAQLKTMLAVYKKQEFEAVEGDFLTTSKPPTQYEFGENHHFEFHQPLSKIEFKMGFIQTIKSIPGVSKKTLIKIHNPYIIPEFEYIKSYFGKIFKKKQIKIYGNIRDKNDSSTYQFTSPDISKIDEQLIDGIKKLEIKRKVNKPKLVAVDKSLFTPEEYFDGFEANLGNNIRKSDQELLEEIFSLQGIRNRKQLEYISGYLHSKKDRIHFTLTPKFGFLFYVEGVEMNHYIWELLDSNATYIWSIDKDLSKSSTLQLISAKINYIQSHGRLKYLSDENNDEFVFNKLNHESAGSKVVDSFPKWRKRLDEKLV